MISHPLIPHAGEISISTLCCLEAPPCTPGFHPAWKGRLSSSTLRGCWMETPGNYQYEIQHQQKKKVQLRLLLLITCVVRLRLFSFLLRAEVQDPHRGPSQA